MRWNRVTVIIVLNRFTVNYSFCTENASITSLRIFIGSAQFLPTVLPQQPPQWTPDLLHMRTLRNYADIKNPTTKVFLQCAFISCLRRHIWTERPVDDALVVLPSQSWDHDGHELLEGGLNLRCELRSHFGGDHNGEAVRQQLEWESNKQNEMACLDLQVHRSQVSSLLWSCQGRRAASRSGGCSDPRRCSWCCPCYSGHCPDHAAPWRRAVRSSRCSWWPLHCRDCRRNQNTSESRGKRWDTCQGVETITSSAIRPRTRRGRIQPTFIFIFVPDQSLGTNVIIVQVGEDVLDDAALLIGPLNHGGSCFTLCSGSREKGWMVLGPDVRLFKCVKGTSAQRERSAVIGCRWRVPDKGQTSGTFSFCFSSTNFNINMPKPEPYSVTVLTSSDKIYQIHLYD